MTRAETDVEHAVREWLGAMTPVNVTTNVVEFTRERFRRFYLNRADQNLPRIASLDDAIAEARAWCSTWMPDDYHYFCWWIRCSCAWPATLPGWQAQLLDAVAEALPNETLSPAAFLTWKAVRNPQDFLLTCRWRELFDRGGYVEDTGLARRPLTKTLVLYRGSTWDTRANWSWTGTYETAEIYRQQHGGPGALVWVALVPRENVLARQMPTKLAGHVYDEYIVDTMRLDKPGWTIPIRPLDIPARRAHWPHCRVGRTRITGTAHRCQECGARLDGRSVRHPLETSRDAFLDQTPASRRFAGAT